MSRTRIPAKGKVGESAAAVARPLQSEYFEPLSRGRERKCLVRLRDFLDRAIDITIMMLRWKRKRKTRKHLTSLKQYTVQCRPRLLMRNDSAIFH